LKRFLILDTQHMIMVFVRVYLGPFQSTRCASEPVSDKWW